MSDLETLGLPFNATVDEIKQTYRFLVKTCHPDIFPDNPDANARFIAITRAYERLLEARTHSAPSNDEDKKRQVFKQVIQLDLFQLLNGTDVTLTEASNVCSACEGTGLVRCDHEIDCSWCMGNGYTFARQGIIRLKVLCTPCNGTGKTEWRPCDVCGGTGLTGTGDGGIHIPADTLPETELFFEGRARRPDGRVADLNVQVKLKEGIYSVDGLDIETRLQLDFSDIVLGGRFKIRLPRGGMVEVVVKPGSFPGKVLRFKDQGFSMEDMRGEFRVILEALPLDLANPAVVQALKALKQASTSRLKA